MIPPLVPPIAYLITPGKATSENFPSYRSELLTTVRLAAEYGVGLVQLREKLLSARLVFELCTDVVRTLNEYPVRVLVNERADIAVASGADGVHLPSFGIRVSDIRAAFGGDLIIGVSTHTAGEVSAAKSDGADFAVFGPVFESPGKGPPVLPKKLANAVRSAAGMPVIALGGIDETNVDLVLEAGAAGFAAIRWLNDREGLIKAAAYLK
jgi:thiamine-phosphate pyrophosphorylase